MLTTLNVPKTASKKFKINFIRAAVCELKFPILLELEQGPPIEIQKKLKKDFPFFDKLLSVEGKVDPSNTDKLEMKSKNPHYQMQSIDKKWTVIIKPDSIALHTTDYLDFEQFYTKTMLVFKQSLPHIDSDFFTRVGLRYINAIPFKNEDFKGYINPSLVAPIEDGVLGALFQCASLLSGSLDDGKYIFRHGMNPPNDKSKDPEYYLDFDYYKEMVNAGDVPELLSKFHENNFSFFYWCIGTKAKAVLGEPI